MIGPTDERSAGSEADGPALDLARYRGIPRMWDDSAWPLHLATISSVTAYGTGVIVLDTRAPYRSYGSRDEAIAGAALLSEGADAGAYAVLERSDGGYDAVGAADAAFSTSPQLDDTATHRGLELLYLLPFHDLEFEDEPSFTHSNVIALVDDGVIRRNPNSD